ncbi:LOW QUALITY PROTEIN: hypothetical protein V1477_010209, partial [Vespula maculifrons]
MDSDDIRSVGVIPTCYGRNIWFAKVIKDPKTARATGLSCPNRSICNFKRNETRKKYATPSVPWLTPSPISSRGREGLWCGRMAEEKRMFAWLASSVCTASLLVPYESSRAVFRMGLESRIARAILWWILQDPQSAFVEMVHTTHLVDADMAGERKAGGVILSSARKIPHFTKDASKPFCDIRFICILYLSAKTSVLRDEESTSIFISSNAKGYHATARLTCLNIVSHKTVTIANLTVVARRLLSSAGVGFKGRFSTRLAVDDDVDVAMDDGHTPLHRGFS